MKKLMLVTVSVLAMVLTSAVADAQLAFPIVQRVSVSHGIQDGTSNTIVWTVGAGGDQRLHGYDGDTGAEVFTGGGPSELMAGTHSYSTTGIVANGRIYVATDNKVFAFRLGTGDADELVSSD